LDFEQALKNFPWESEEQRKGYFALVKYLSDKGVIITEINPTAAFFIQKDHESHEWMIEMLSRVLGEMKTEILTLRTALERAGISVT
jgi:hypothetical protein